jgi:hypothetical protein
MFVITACLFSLSPGLICSFLPLSLHCCLQHVSVPFQYICPALLAFLGFKFSCRSIVWRPCFSVRYLPVTHPCLLFLDAHLPLCLRCVFLFIPQVDGPASLEGINAFSANARPVARTHAAMTAVAPLIGFETPVSIRPPPSCARSLSSLSNFSLIRFITGCKRTGHTRRTNREYLMSREREGAIYCLVGARCYWRGTGRTVGRRMLWAGQWMHLLHSVVRYCRSSCES